MLSFEWRLLREQAINVIRVAPTGSGHHMPKPTPLER
jgi:hypothetical protein